MPAPRNPRLYVGNLPYTATEDDVREFFAGFNVTQVRFIFDRETNRPRGFCFVEVATPAEQKSAIEKLDGQQLNGRRVVVNEAKDKERPKNTEGARQKSW